MILRLTLKFETCRLAICDDLLGRLEELVGRLAIREATAEVISRLAVVILTAAVSCPVCRREFQLK